MAQFSLLGMVTILYGLFIGGRSIFEPFVFIPLVLLIILMVALFMLPLSNAHDIMAKKKAEILGILSDRHYRAYKRFKEKAKEGDSMSEDALTELEGIDLLYNKANEMPVWPFDMGLLSKFLLFLGIPLLLIIIQTILDISLLALLLIRENNLNFLILNLFNLFVLLSQF